MIVVVYFKYSVWPAEIFCRVCIQTMANYLATFVWWRCEADFLIQYKSFITNACVGNIVHMVNDRHGQDSSSDFGTRPHWGLP